MLNAAKILIYDKSKHVLVLRRSDTHPHWPHEADLPGGMIEIGEKPLEAIVREVAEETELSIATQDISLVGKRITSYGRTDYIYRVTLDSVKPDVTISWEHESYTWTPETSLRDVLVTKDDYMVVVYHYLDGVLHSTSVER